MSISDGHSARCEAALPPRHQALLLSLASLSRLLPPGRAAGGGVGVARFLHRHVWVAGDRLGTRLDLSHVLKENEGACVCVHTCTGVCPVCVIFEEKER